MEHHTSGTSCHSEQKPKSSPGWGPVAPCAGRLCPAVPYLLPTVPTGRTPLCVLQRAFQVLPSHSLFTFKALLWIFSSITPSFMRRSLPQRGFPWPPAKPKNTEVGSLSLLQGIFPTQESNQGLLYCRRILCQLSYQGSWNKNKTLQGRCEIWKSVVNRTVAIVVS